MLKIDIPSDVKTIADLLNGYLIGGSVRDAIMGKEPNDWDVASPYTPEQMRKILAGHEYKILPYGEKYGTLMIMLPSGEKVEVTTFRNETYTKEQGRHPNVNFITDIEGDLSRRDLTINAMAYEPREEKLIDPFGGQKDIDSKTVRFVGDTVKRIDEDPLRLIRACRFSSKLGFDIDQKDKDIMARESGKIKSVAEERVFDELKKGSDAFGAMFRCMSDTGLTKNVLGIDTDAMKDTIHDFRGSHHGESVFEHTIETTQCLDSMSKDNISLKLAGVYHDVGKPYTEEKKDGKIMFLRHEEKSKEICDDTLGKIKGVPRDISDATCWMVGEHIRYPNLSAPNKIASNAVDWKMHNISSKEIADLTKLVECDMSKNIDNLFEKTMVAYNTPKPSGQAFMHLPENMRSQAIRSTWIENATNAIKQMDKNV